VRLTYDRQADAAYLYLKEGMKAGESARTVVCHVDLHGASIHLDFDSEDRLIGVEVLGASRIMQREALQRADAP